MFLTNFKMLLPLSWIALLFGEWPSGRPTPHILIIRLVCELSICFRNRHSEIASLFPRNWGKWRCWFLGTPFFQEPNLHFWRHHGCAGVALRVEVLVQNLSVLWEVASRSRWFVHWTLLLLIEELGRHVGNKIIRVII